MNEPKSFKIHNKLNRLTELSITMARDANAILKLAAMIKLNQRTMELFTINYLQDETEYGELIHEEINNREQIDALIEKHRLEDAI